MRGGEIRGEVIEDEHALFAKTVEEEVAELLVILNANKHQRTEVRHPDGRATFEAELIDGLGETRGATVDGVPELRPLRVQELEHRVNCGDGERMTHERAGKKRDAFAREGIISILPHPAVEGVHVFRLACDNPNRHAPADDLAVGGEIRLHAEIGLSATGTAAQSRHDFIKDQQSSVLRGQTAQLLDEFLRTPFRTAALHRLHHHGSDLAGVRPDELKGAIRAVVEHPHVLDGTERNARRHRH